MNGSIIVIQADGQPVEMTKEEFKSEVELQGLLASYPNILAGDQIDSSTPRKWLLISREVAVPVQEGGPGRFVLDHLLLDQDAIPTLVEVKLRRDTRIRREVIGQMLDYAANGAVYWPVDKFREKFEADCEKSGLDPVDVLRQTLDATVDEERFWEDVRTNLEDGFVRLLFVADEIPIELQRVVEFLNGQMNRAEVLAIQITQYASQNGLKTYVPSVIGRTTRSIRTKAGDSGGKKPWNATSFRSELEETRGMVEADIAEKILEWTKHRSLQVDWGSGGKAGSFTTKVEHSGMAHSLIQVRTDGRVYIKFVFLKQRLPFSDIDMRQQLLKKLNAIPGIDIAEHEIDRLPVFFLDALTDDALLNEFLATLDWVVGEIRNT